MNEIKPPKQGVFNTIRIKINKDLETPQNTSLSLYHTKFLVKSGCQITSKIRLIPTKYY